MFHEQQSHETDLTKLQNPQRLYMIQQKRKHADVKRPSGALSISLIDSWLSILDDPAVNS